jgi:hypothetical protein
MIALDRLYYRYSDHLNIQNLLKEQQNAVVKASDRVAKYRESVESDQRKTKRTLDLVASRRRNGSNPCKSSSFISLVIVL